MSKLANRIHNGCDVIDSRDVIERINELESELQDTHDIERREWADLQTELADLEELPPDAEPAEDFEEWLRRAHDSGEDDVAELFLLRTLIAELEAHAGEAPRHGVTMIRDSYFESYAQELAEDTGAIDRNATWPNTHIDWEAAADALKQDYCPIDYDGVEYWVRS